MAEKASVRNLPCMDVQSNWDEVAKKGKEKFWVSCRRQGQPTLHGSLLLPASYSPPSSRDAAGERFSVVAETTRTVTVECPEAGCQTKFIQPLKTLPLCDSKILCMDVSGSGGLGICSTDNGTLWIWDTDTGETRRNLEGHVMEVNTCLLFPSGVVVVSGGADMRVKVWSAVDGSCPRTFTGHTGGISDAAIIDRGRNIVSVSRDGSAKLWDCGSARCLATLSTSSSPINCCALSSSSLVGGDTSTPPEPECGTNGKLLLLASEDGQLKSIDIRNRQSVFQYGPGTVSMTTCAFVSEFTAVCGSVDGVISAVDLRRPGEAVGRFSFSSSPICSLLSLSNHHCISGQSDGTCTIWSPNDIISANHNDVITSDQLKVSKLTGPNFDHITSIRLSTNTIYTSCRDGCVRLYSVDDV